MEVIKPGTRVTIADNIEAVVDAVQIETSDRVSYAVVWWDGRNRRREWLAAPEVFMSRTRPGTTIGFQE